MGVIIIIWNDSFCIALLVNDWLVQFTQTLIKYPHKADYWVWNFMRDWLTAVTVCQYCDHNNINMEALYLSYKSCAGLHQHPSLQTLIISVMIPWSSSVLEAMSSSTVWEQQESKLDLWYVTMSQLCESRGCAVYFRISLKRGQTHSSEL